MAAINIMAFILGILLISVWFDTSPLEALPLLWSALAFVLYGLCYARWLSAIDYCSMVLIPFLCVGLYWTRKEIPIWWKKNGSLQQILLLILIALLCLAVNWKSTVLFQDDMNYWATSVYALYSRDGLETMHANVSKGYGDYPLGLQLLEWWFMHIFGGGWQDRWLFIAYDLLTFSFVLPIFRHVNGKWYALPICILMTLLLASFSSSFSTTLAPDVFMGVVYGNCLLCTIRALNGKNNRHFQEVLIAGQLYMLTMTKSIGVFWAALAWVFYMLLTSRNADRKESTMKNRRLLTTGILMLIPALTGYGMWRYACKALDRTTYLTQNLKTVGLVWNQERIQLVRDYLFTLLAVPRTDRLFDISLSIELLLLGIAFYIIARAFQNSRRIILTIGSFLSGTMFLYLLLLLYSFLTVFWGENPSCEQIIAMVMRYCSPAIAALAFIPTEALVNHFGIMRSERRTKISTGVAVLALMMAVNYNVPKYFFCPYLDEDLQEIDIQAENDYYAALLQTVKKIGHPHESYLLYCDEGDSVWQHRVSIQWILRDTSVTSVPNTDYGTVWWYIETIPATHLYISGCPNGRIGQGKDQRELEFSVMYSIDRTKNGIRLDKLE